MSRILAAQYFQTNAEIIEACARLGYFKKNSTVLDPTYGQGNWWTLFRPSRLHTHDLLLDGVDFRATGYPDQRFDSIAFDPPYVSVGGRDSTRIKEMYDAYGMTGAPTTPKLLQQLINDGLKEMYRLVRPPKKGQAKTHPHKGIVVVKSMDYISSGQFFPGSFYTEQYAYKLGFSVQDKFIHVRKSAGPQPGNRMKRCIWCVDGFGCPKCNYEGVIPSVQEHAARNVSNLLVLRRMK